MLRRITEVLITSDLLPPLSESAPRSSLVLSSIYVSTLTPTPSTPLWHFVNLSAAPARDFLQDDFFFFVMVEAFLFREVKVRVKGSNKNNDKQEHRFLTAQLKLRKKNISMNTLLYCSQLKQCKQTQRQTCTGL